MNILILNASPKGPNSVTLQTALYLKALHTEHQFELAHVGQRIKSLERDFTPLREQLRWAELLLFCYPVYTFIAPYQLHRLIELIKADGIDLRGKFASQITTSKHFYDVTAHRFIEENCLDLGLNTVRGLSADMDDLLTPKGQAEARMFFEQLMFSCRHGLFVTPQCPAPRHKRAPYAQALAESAKREGREVVIVTNCARDDKNLSDMIADFQAALSYPSRVVNIREFKFDGGCLGCFGCAVSGKCVYGDGFDEFLRTRIQTADALVYAFTIENHYAHSSFKCYDDRQFCNGHRTVTHGTPAAYIISGDYSCEPNLRTIVEARCEVGGNYLCGVATDESDTTAQLSTLASAVAFAIDNRLSRPANFYGVGGMKIFRDLIYVMRGLMKADHRYYKQHGVYDFPQKQRKRILQMQLVGALTAIPQVQSRLKGRMNQYIIAPYRQVVDSAGSSSDRRPTGAQ